MRLWETTPMIVMQSEMNYSVAMCTYNGAAFVKEQLQSIMDQTIRPVQVVVCDDKSLDETVSIVKDFAKDNPSADWKIIENNENIGFVRNFEQAIGLCDNEIVFLSDQDDVWLPEKAEKILDYFQKTNFSVVFSDALLVDEQRNSLGITMFENIRFSKENRKKFHRGNNGRGLLLRKSLVTGATMALKKRDVLEYLPVPSNDYFIHDGWIATLAGVNKQLGFIDEPLILYRQHQNQNIGGKLDLNLQDRDQLFWEEKLGIKVNDKKSIRLIASISCFWEREKVVYDFVITHPELFPQRTIRFLKKRKKLIANLLKQPNSFLERLGNISWKLFYFKIVEFQTFRQFAGNSLHYLFNK